MFGRRTMHLPTSGVTSDGRWSIGRPARCRKANSSLAGRLGAKRVHGATIGRPSHYRRAVEPQLRSDACRLSPSETRENHLPTGSRLQWQPLACRLRSLPPRRSAVAAYVQPFLTSRPLGPVHSALPSESLTRATTVNGETRVLCAWLLCLHHADPVTAAACGGDGRTAVPLDPSPLFLTTRPEQRTVGPADSERARCYPKDGELCMSRTKPEETLVEDSWRSHAVLSGKANDQRDWGRNVLILFSNFEWVRRPICLEKSCPAGMRRTASGLVLVLVDIDSRTVAMEVGIRQGVCNNSPAESTSPENGWRSSAEPVPDRLGNVVEEVATVRVEGVERELAWSRRRCRSWWQ
ncbi:hypothetical protein TTRE_0000940601 [Trichuris trichiura]|uniref:Uncharacterized protein n=1 Tax=Trichuris trichiura TaxID=36087 RepID=A0A077ZKW9_TRITR|nr:hypothetical protein TTRE_0000940601 [Trichuris trichiura]